jgi:hypothetical protein
MRGFVFILAVSVFFDVAATRPAAACTPVDNWAHVLDPAQADDHTPPSAVTVHDVIVSRDSGGDGCAASCGGPDLTIQLTASDDRSGPIGYRVAIVGGRPPRGLWINPEPVAPAYGASHLQYLFEDDDYGWSFDVELRAVDGNGNLGPATRVTIADPDAPEGGCAAARRSRSSVGLAIAAALVTRRRRRR